MHSVLAVVVLVAQSCLTLCDPVDWTDITWRRNPALSPGPGLPLCSVTSCEQPQQSEEGRTCVHRHGCWRLPIRHVSTASLSWGEIWGGPHKGPAHFSLLSSPLSWPEFPQPWTHRYGYELESHKGKKQPPWLLFSINAPIKTDFSFS